MPHLLAERIVATYIVFNNGHLYGSVHRYSHGPHAHPTNFNFRAVHSKATLPHISAHIAVGEL